MGPPDTPVLLHNHLCVRVKKTGTCGKCVCRSRQEPIGGLGVLFPWPRFPNGHSAAGVTVHMGAVTWALRKQPCFYMSLTLEARILFQNFRMILFEGMFHKHWAVLGFEPNSTSVELSTSPREE